MAKIRPYIPTGPAPLFYVTVIHFSGPDAFGPQAWHCIWVYTPEELYPGADVWAYVDTLAHGEIMARGWSSFPAMINDACLSCRYSDYGPALPRWNIYRGQEHASRFWWPPDSPPRIIPCFAQPYWDAPPPGFA